MHDENYRREDDSLLRKIAIGVMVTIIVQAGGWIYMIGSLGNQVRNNTKSIDMLAKAVARKQRDAVSIAKTQVLVESLTTAVNRLVDNLDRVVRKQEQQTPVIERMTKYLNKYDGGARP